MRKSHLLDLVEAAYAPEPSTSRWLTGVVRAARPLLDRGEGLVAVNFDASETTSVSLGEPVFDGASLPAWRGMQQATETLSPVAIRRTYLGARPFGSVSQRFAGKTRDIYLDLARRCYRPHGYRDLLVLHVVSPAGEGCILAAPTPREYAASRKELALWARIAAHVRSGYALHRRALAHSKEVAASKGADAVLTPHGKLLHARPRSGAFDAREALRRAAIEMDRTRVRLTRSRGESGKLWLELCAGRWTLVDHFDSDGRRYLVAHRNDASTARWTRLTERERQVVDLTLRGSSNKLISYELGIGESSVSEHLSIALAKLGLRSTSELLRLAALLDPRE